ncbi:MAG: SDR family NAD(P)-dependent oxidoreductase [Candidatus Nanopelagicales bacterium]
MSRPLAVVLGAGIGGTAVAQALAQDWFVVVVDRDESLARALAESVGGEWAVVDLLDVDAVIRFRDDLLSRHGRVDAVVHLVGGWKGSASVDLDALAAWDAIAPGVFGTVRTTTVAFREPLEQSPSGRYVMVSSTAVAKPTAGNVAYATAKAASETWVRGLAHAFRNSPARAIIVTVKALVDDRMRQADPAQEFPGYTDTRDLAAAIAGTLEESGPANGTRLDLTEA